MFLPEVYVSRSRMVAGVMAKKPVQMSFLGVGAPEALLVGVVALVVFGPKGLADAAKSVGQALRSFQPTIREVVEVTSDLKGTLEQELGLNELREAARVPPPRPRTLDDPATPGLAAAMSAASVDDDPDIEAKRRASAAAAWGAPPPPAAPASTSESAPAPAPLTPNVPQTLEAPVAAAAASLSDEALEAELARRRAAKSAGSPGSQA
eukprot:CAMPEP_0202865272 /NCGR_PEP_ID=MMETSP1391-20130828/5518_1 /ASSEMBLY_ACC=CAM_ASM_000867 /TAXON_ID=1034604 /ORGANISM="Chlamydomonas leiostraca, Strain SAG 11-49" /LENGTH=207 /DNA_ID=CAMNT_0049545095 /DNA_START=196 /DNA_END=819 /DNA_ORIENTATION=+